MTTLVVVRTKLCPAACGCVDDCPEDEVLVEGMRVEKGLIQIRMGSCCTSVLQYCKTYALR